MTSSSSSSSKSIWVIVVVIAVMLAVPVAGIIAAIAIPNLLTAMQRSKQKRTMADMRSIATAVEAYAVDHNTYPPPGSSMDDVASLVTPTYIREMPMVDGWNQPFRYHCLAPEEQRCVDYAFQSAGKDGVFEYLPYELEPEATTRFDCDIVYASGQFVWYPEGAQR